MIAAYAIVSWILLQVGEVTFEPLRLPEWSMSVVVMLVILGFPVVLALAWFFDFTRTGIRLDARRFGVARPNHDRPSIAVLPFKDPIDRYRDEARQASERALQLDPGLAEAHASRGLAFLVSEEFEKAEDEFKKALELNSKLFQAYHYYDRSRFHQGDLETAAALFRQAADVDPSDYQSRCLRTKILRGAGKTDEAVAQAQEAVSVVEKHLERNPDDARALHLGAGSLIALGQVKRAKRWLRRALEMDPDDSVLLYNVACNFASLGELDEATGKQGGARPREIDSGHRLTPDGPRGVASRNSSMLRGLWLPGTEHPDDDTPGLAGFTFQVGRHVQPKSFIGGSPRIGVKNIEYFERVHVQ